ncbi:MAG: sulfatase-like hydrolase/transferase, partial [Myxococcota bacterium]|nr:sulfatase-like hydrolase/transferase [Myxococcota bacterium]
MGTSSIFIAGTLVLATFLGSGTARAEAPARNVVVITVDTLRADVLGAYGSEEGASPNIDAFARDAMVFEHAWAHSTWTVPSYISFMSSLHVKTHGWNHGRDETDWRAMSPDLTTLAEYLSRQGFESRAWVANTVLEKKLGFDRGFSFFEVHRAEKRMSQWAHAQMETWKPGGRHFLYLHLMSPHRPLRPSPEAIRRFGLVGELP